MMLLDRVLYNLENKQDNLAMRNGNRQYTYGELYVKVKQAYKYLIDNNISNKILLYGHKEIEMIAFFIASAMLGISYIPVDDSIPKYRLEQIINDSKPQKIISISNETINNIFNSQTDDIDLNISIKPDSIYYIIYTSGSTGTPKGVKVKYSNLDSFVKWFSENISKEENIILNQASFSFDLSVADIYLALYTASELVIIPSNIQKSYKDMFSYLNNINCSIAVFTPSFAEMLLIDKSFNSELMKELNVLYFCGETLQRETALKLKERFPNTRIINSYGPTECTVAVTMIDIKKEDLIEEHALPVGIVKNGTKIYIVDSELREVLNGNKR